MKTGKMTKGIYTPRIGTKADLDRQIKQGIDRGMLVQKQGAAQTVAIVSPEDFATTPPIEKGQAVMRAMHKGGGIWLFLYHKGAYGL